MGISFEYFEKRFEVLEANFGFKTKAELIPFIYEQLKKLRPEEFDQGFNGLMSKSRQEWSEIYDYGKTPTVADWKNLFGGKRKLTVEDLARMEVEKILHESRHSFSSWKPENETTKRVLASFNNGLSTIHFELYDSYNENKKNLSFFRKDLIEKWLAFNDIKDEERGALEIHHTVKNLLPNFKALD